MPRRSFISADKLRVYIPLGIDEENPDKTLVNVFHLEGFHPAIFSKEVRRKGRTYKLFELCLEVPNEVAADKAELDRWYLNHLDQRDLKRIEEFKSKLN